MKVLKFGGKSIATPDRFKFAANIVSNKEKCIAVIPAMPEITSILEDVSDYLYRKNIEGANEAISKLHKELISITDNIYTLPQTKTQAEVYVNEKIEFIKSFTKDLFTLFEERIILAQGELINSHLFYLLLVDSKIKACEISALDFMRIDKNSEPDASYIKENLHKLLNNNESTIYITQGYICQNTYGEIDDFRKGGNDYTATLIGAAINAEEIQIWTDVEGMTNIDPRIIDKAKTIDNLSFDEAAELAYFGDKVLHPTSILPAKLANIPVRILSISNIEEKGTLISDKAEKNKIKAIAAKDNITAITIKSSKMLLAHGFLRKIAEVFEHHQTSIDMLASSEVGISFTIDNPIHLDAITDDLKKHGTVSVDKNMAIICIIGDLEWKNTQTRSKVLDAIKHLPIRVISYGGSNYNFSFLIEMSEKERTLKILNDNLF